MDAGLPLFLAVVACLACSRLCAQPDWLLVLAVFGCVTLSTVVAAARGCECRATTRHGPK